MNQSLTRGALLGALLTPATAVTADDADIDALRAELAAMRSQYESRIQALESRLHDTEQAAEAARRAANADALSLPMTAPRVLRSQGQASAQVPAGSRSAGLFDAVTAGAAFNPQISVILDGNYYQDDTKEGNGAALVGEAFQAGGGHGHDHGHDHGGGDDGHDHGGHAHAVAENGFNFREAEISFSATVDPYFDAATYISIDGDGNVELEEAYFQTRSLPYGLRVKGGKFLSGFGYANSQHPHQWDFVDQNLPYLNLLGFHGLQDTGVQVTWLPELPIYTLLGAEALQGNQEVFGATLDATEQAELNLGDTDSGPRLFTAFAKIAPEIGRNHALQLGVSYAHATQQQAVHEHTHAVHEHDHEHGHEHEAEHGAEHAHADEHAHAEHHDDMHDHGDGITEELHRAGLAGDADLWGIDLVYKYDAPGADGRGDITFQTEYLRSSKDLTVRSSAHPERIGSNRTFTTDGLYAQATYGFLPKWKAGLRYDVLGLTNKVSGGRSDSFGSSERWTADVTWSLSEFSQLRAQYAYNDILIGEDDHGEARERFSAFYLQFLMSLGSHGAHEF